MAISHELSSDIATALFAAKERSPKELDDLKKTVFDIHATLERLTKDTPANERKSQRKQKTASNNA